MVILTVLVHYSYPMVGTWNSGKKRVDYAWDDDMESLMIYFCHDLPRVIQSSRAPPL